MVKGTEQLLSEKHRSRQRGGASEKGPLAHRPFGATRRQQGQSK